jgi:recombination protein RecR
MSYPNSLIQLIREFSRLPGVGPKSAQRLAFYVFGAEEAEIDGLLDAITTAKRELRHCSICANITDNEVCSICNDNRRDQYHICIVENPNDVIAIERTGSFNGLYHVLHGAYSPMDGMGAERLRLSVLLGRLQQHPMTHEQLDPSRFELILATSTTPEGDATASLVHHQAGALGALVTRIAYGLPSGTALEMTDETTIGRALLGRQKL